MSGTCFPSLLLRWKLLASARSAERCANVSHRTYVVSAGLPTTMEDWQLRLRAQKEQDRKLKTETAEMLRGYRGGVKEDDLKLSALKMEDRKKQQDAERILRDYRAKEFGEGRERPVRKDVDYPPVVAKQDDDPFIVQGNVSALAATFDSPVNVNDAKLSGAEVSQFSVPSLDVDGYNDVDDLVESEYAVDEKKSDSLDSPSDGVLVESWGQNDDEEPLHDHPTVVRLDVNFSFGLLTTSSNPILDNYMLAVEETVQQALLANPNLAIHVSYNARFGPFVEECQWDGK